MYSMYKRVLGLYLLFLVLQTACGDIVPIWVGQQDLSDYTIYTAENPCEFSMVVDPIGEQLKLRLELEITYDIGISRSSLPIRLVILNKDKSKTLFSKETIVQLKAEGEWLGIPEENEIDYTIAHNAIPSLTIAPGTYVLEVYANDQDQAKIYGIVSITARLYPS